MKKLLALIEARNKEFYRDRSAMGWTLIFPLIVLLGFTYGYSGKQDPVFRVAATSENVLAHPALQSFLSTPSIEVKMIKEEQVALRKVERFESDLILSVSGSEANSKITYTTNSDSEKGKFAEHVLNLSTSKNNVSLESKKLEGVRIRYSDWVLPGLLAMNIMFGSMFGVGYVIVRYRKNGVLKRLRATPLSAFQFLFAQVISRVLLLVLTSFLVLFAAMFIIGFRFHGNWISLLLFLTLSSTAMIAVGLTVAARINTEEVADGVLNLMTWPMMFLSGVWFSIDDANPWVIWISKAMPLTHVVKGLRAIMIDGMSLAQILPEIGVLLILSFIFITISAAIFRWR